MSLIARHPTATLVVAMTINGTIGAMVIEAGTDPVTTVFWRAVFGTAFLLPWCLGGGLLAPSRLTKRGLLLGLAAGVSMVLSWVAYLAGFGLTDIATTTILYHVQRFRVITGSIRRAPTVKAGKIANGWLSRSPLAVLERSSSVG